MVKTPSRDWFWALWGSNTTGATGPGPYAGSLPHLCHIQVALAAVGGWQRLIVRGWWSLGALLKGGPSAREKKKKETV